jgi:hypothetical protein
MLISTLRIRELLHQEMLESKIELYHKQVGAYVVIHYKDVLFISSSVDMRGLVGYTACVKPQSLPALQHLGEVRTIGQVDV